MSRKRRMRKNDYKKWNRTQSQCWLASCLKHWLRDWRHTTHSFLHYTQLDCTIMSCIRPSGFKLSVKLPTPQKNQGQNQTSLLVFKWTIWYLSLVHLVGLTNKIINNLNEVIFSKIPLVIDQDEEELFRAESHRIKFYWEIQETNQNSETMFSTCFGIFQPPLSRCEV